MTVSWTEPYSGRVTGVDHLGLRITGEATFAKLFDFTTSVTFRPRYYSFLCWALREAFIEAGGTAKAQPGVVHHIDTDRWVRAVKRRDYLFGLATLLADPEAQRIAGSTKLLERIADSTEAGEAASFEIRDDHLNPNARGGPAAAGSLAIYAGAMRSLRLLETADDPTLDRPSPKGMQLADAFAATLASSGHAAAIEAAAKQPGSTLPREVLEAMGKVCGAGRLTSAGDAPKRERELLCAAILDWDAADRGSGAVIRRLQSIGLTLATREAGLAAKTEEEEFRAACLDGTHPLTRIEIQVPSSYRRVLGNWRLYHAHAYATLALEHLLAAVVDILHERVTVFGTSMTRKSLVEALRQHLGDGSAAVVPASLAGWTEWPIGKLLGTLGEGGANADGMTEYALADCLGKARGLDARTQRAAILFFRSITRMEKLRGDGDEWLGERAPLRLPPDYLVEHARSASTQNETARTYFSRLVEALVVDQHVKNALRKLAIAPEKPTARLICEGHWVRLVPDSDFRPGTSNSRYANAVMFLEDLGFLEHGSDAGLTPEGKALLSKLREAA